MLAIVLPPSHEATAITRSVAVHLVPSDAGYMFILFFWLQVRVVSCCLACCLVFQVIRPLCCAYTWVAAWGAAR